MQLSRLLSKDESQRPAGCNSKACEPAVSTRKIPGKSLGVDILTIETSCNQQRSKKDMRMRSTGKTKVSIWPSRPLQCPRDQTYQFAEITSTYPHNGQCHFSNPKPPLNIPFLTHASHDRRRPPLPSHSRSNMQ